MAPFLTVLSGSLTSFFYFQPSSCFFSCSFVTLPLPCFLRSSLFPLFLLRLVTFHVFRRHIFSPPPHPLCSCLTKAPLLVSSLHVSHLFAYCLTGWPSNSHHSSLHVPLPAGCVTAVYRAQSTGKNTQESYLLRQNTTFK